MAALSQETPMNPDNNAASPERQPGSRPAWPHVSSLELSALPTAVSCARLHTTQLLWEWKLDHLAEDAGLLVSELVTNAVNATASTGRPGLVTLSLKADRHRLIIESWDQCPADPQPRDLTDDSEGGRGLAVITALSHCWGHDRISPTLKVVWCELLSEPDEESNAEP
jgi:anti-sigma regulatory factor (Ser/Thr protein kinase)